MLSCRLREYYCGNFGHLRFTVRRLGLAQDGVGTGRDSVQIGFAPVYRGLDLLVCTPIGNWVVRTKLLNQ